MSRFYLIVAIGSIITLVATVYFRSMSSKNVVENEENKLVDDEIIQRFFEYHGSANSSEKKVEITNKSNCAPCAAKAAAMKAGGVPSKPREAKTDPPFQRITGRTQDFVSPVLHGNAKIQVPETIDAWVSISHGMPFEQIRCRIELSDTGITISSLSGIITEEKQLVLDWKTDPSPQLGTWGPRIKKSAQDVWETLTSIPSSINTEQVYYRYRAQAVSAERLFFVSATPTQHFYDDLEMHISETGHISQITHIQATYVGDNLNATRQIWLISKP